MISTEKLEGALAYLARTDDEIAEAKAVVARSEYLAKLREAFAFKTAEGDTVRDREVVAKTDAEAQEAWNRHFMAVVDYEKLRAKRERAVLTVDVWRSENASRRQGQIT